MESFSKKFEAMMILADFICDVFPCSVECASFPFTLGKN